MPHAMILLGPADHGRSMSLAEFDRAEGQPGRDYELSRRVVTVVDVPDFRHLAQVDALRQQLAEYRAAHPGVIHHLAGGGECKILLADLESERHPDIAVYKTAPVDQEDLWAAWIPELVIEVVSPSSEHRDYGEKREEYLRFGVKEYWIVDASRREVLVLRRSGGVWKERVLRPPEIYKTRLLPGFEFACEAVFRAAEEVAG